MLPHLPDVIKCPDCDKLFRFSTNDGIEESDYKGKARAQWPKEPTFEDLLEFAGNQDLTRQQEREVRISAWWIANDESRRSLSRRRRNTELSHLGAAPGHTNGTAFAQNLEQLLVLLDGDEPSDWLMGAEILRELGRFSEATSRLNRPFPKKFQSLIRTLQNQCEQRDPQVCRWEPARVRHHAYYARDMIEAAMTRAGEEANRLYRLAVEECKVVVEWGTDDHNALSHWGIALSFLADGKSGEEANQLYREAKEKYQRALEVSPSGLGALARWTGLVLDRAKTLAGNETEALYRKAEELLFTAEAQSPGIAAYELACFYDFTGQEEACKDWLIKAHRFDNLPDREQIEADPWLTNIQSTQWFHDFLESISRSPAEEA
jgi:tetratricopeptide (TPR) repeat protein